jgi:LAGLIDADG endonuclease
VIDWKYLAGFADGEGCFSIGNHGSQMLFSLSQTESQSLVLDLIAEFYDKKGISYSWSYTPGYEKTNASYRLAVSGQSSLRKLVLGILPHLIVKRVDAEATLEFLNAKKRARLKREAECKFGHKRTEDNIYTHAKTGKKSCLECRRIRSRNLSIPGYAAP